VSTPDTTPRPKPAWALTISFWIALAAFYFTSENPVIFVIAIIAIWPHFLTARLARDTSATWIIRLILYGGVFAFFGGKPGIGADWIFDAKTFNAIGLIAAGETVLQMWRVPPHGARYHSLAVLCIAIVFLAACNTYDDRTIKFFAPAYILFTLLALRGQHDFRSTPGAVPLLPRGRGLVAIAFVLFLGAATHFGIVAQRQNLMRWGFEMMQGRRFFQSTGVSEQPRLSSTFNLRGSTRRVLKIEGALNDPHLRAAAFDTYANGNWTPALSSREKTAFPEIAAAQNKKFHRARITKLDDLNTVVFAPLNAVAITPAPGSSFDWNPTLGPVICEDTAPYSYDVTWSEDGDEYGVALHQGILCRPISRSDEKRWLQLPPEVDPRVRELAFDLTADALHPAQQVEAIAEYLLSNNKYARTTTRGKGDPVSNFILEKKSAHCEYFASATVVLLRAAGVPARYVTGYLAHERDGTGTVVRQRDAHAWAEAWIDGAGWITVDATPADGTPEANPPISAWQRAWEKFQDTFQKWRERATALSGAQVLVLVLFVVAIWLVERWRIRFRKHSQSSPASEYSSPAQLRALATRFEKLLRKHNGEIASSRPLWEYSHSEAARQFLREYHRARFGGACDENVMQSLNAQLERLEKGDLNDNRTQAAAEIENKEQQPKPHPEYSRHG
jgi:transglutaminase-like putative cysteine protease